MTTQLCIRSYKNSLKNRPTQTPTLTSHSSSKQPFAAGQTSISFRFRLPRSSSYRHTHLALPFFNCQKSTSQQPPLFWTAARLLFSDATSVIKPTFGYQSTAALQTLFVCNQRRPCRRCTTIWSPLERQQRRLDPSNSHQTNLRRQPTQTQTDAYMYINTRWMTSTFTSRCDCILIGVSEIKTLAPFFSFLSHRPWVSVFFFNTRFYSNML